MVPVSSQLADRAGAARGADGAETTLRALALEEMPSFLLEAVRRQEPVVISDPGSDPRVPQSWVGLFQAKSALVVPLIHQGRTAGVLILDHLKTLHVFTDEESASPPRWPPRPRWRSRRRGSTTRSSSACSRPRRCSR